MMADRSWIRGVPQPLPSGESLVWQGGPDRAALARHALHVRALTVYFGAIMLLGLIGAVRDDVALPQILTALLLQSLLSGMVIGAVHLYARLIAANTVYAITDRRVVMKVGIVLPTTINIPFRLIDSAAIHTFRDGTGQIALKLLPPDRIGYFHLWPHARGWRLRFPEPSFRGLVNAQQVGEVLRSIALESGDAVGGPPPAPERKESAESGIVTIPMMPVTKGAGS